MKVRALVVVLLLGVVAVAGCTQKDSKNEGDKDAARTTGYTAWELAALPLNVSGAWSQTLHPGPYGIKAGTGHFVKVDLPITELGATVLDPVNGPRAHLGLFMPDVPPGTKVPVIADVGPYYRTSGSQLPQNEGDTVATQPANRLGRFLIENFVPHGYAVAQVSVMGSGDSNHCFDMFGMAEQLGVNAAVSWLGKQEWSNGNVALIGRSYDGSTPWQAAAFGNEHLKTIVPISGLHGLRALTTHNGSSEARTITFHNVVYGQFGIDGDFGDTHHICPDYLTATPIGAAAVVTGDEVIPTDEGYWREREFLPRVLQNYKGSVYFIHGLQDWNVDPRLISPAFDQLREKGLDVKGLFGQWGHHYPDRPGEHATLRPGLGKEAFPHTVRYEWAEDLLEWFNYYLKNKGPKPILDVEIQDQIGRWRVESDFPPRDTIPHVLSITGSNQQLMPNGPALNFTFPAVNDTVETLMSGHIYVDATVVPLGANGQIVFRVTDSTNSKRLAFGTMDLRYRNGDTPQPIVPGMPLKIRIQSQPLDFVLPAGHGLNLSLMPSGEGYLAAPSAGPITFQPGDSSLVLPVIHRKASAFFTPVQWNGTANATAPQP